jgi:hypothetical protein
LGVPNCARTRGHDFGVHRFDFIQFFVRFRLGDLQRDHAGIHLPLRRLHFQLSLLGSLGIEKAGPRMLDRFQGRFLARILLMVDLHLLSRSQVN